MFLIFVHKRIRTFVPDIKNAYDFEFKLYIVYLS